MPTYALGPSFQIALPNQRRDLLNTLLCLCILYTVYSTISWEKNNSEKIGIFVKQYTQLKRPAISVKNVSHNAILAVSSKICVNVGLVTCRLVYNHGVFVLSLI